jgi:hypothetical protein
MGRNSPNHPAEKNPLPDDRLEVQHPPLFEDATMKDTMSAELIETINREAQHIPIAASRWKELSVELTQLRTAAAATKPTHDFDRDPTSFMDLLRANR